MALYLYMIYLLMHLLSVYNFFKNMSAFTFGNYLNFHNVDKIYLNISSVQ